MNRQLVLTDSLVSTVAGGSPAVQALTLAYAKKHVRALGNADDELTAARIDAAASYFFEQTGRSPLTQTRCAGLSAFPFVGATGRSARIELPHPPLRGVTSVKYVNSNGVLTDFSGGSPVAPLWRVVTYAGDFAQRGYLEPLYNQAWPTARDQTDAVQIVYTSGYADTPATVPALVRAILCLLCGHFDQFPSATTQGPAALLPLGVDQLMNSFKYSAYPTQVLRERGEIVWNWP